MSQTYLGEKSLKLEDSPMKDWTRVDIAMNFVERYGGIDGDHHKAWVLDQVARALKGAPIIDLRIASWSTGETNLRWELGSSTEYELWVVDMLGEYDPEKETYEYRYDTGIAP